MLRKDVVAAVQAGRFTIYAVSNIDEGIAILSGRPVNCRPMGATPQTRLIFWLIRN
jgi:hypothetical protein